MTSARFRVEVDGGKHGHVDAVMDRGGCEGALMAVRVVARALQLPDPPLVQEKHGGWNARAGGMPLRAVETDLAESRLIEEVCGTANLDPRVEQIVAAFEAANRPMFVEVDDLVASFEKDPEALVWLVDHGWLEEVLSHRTKDEDEIHDVERRGKNGGRPSYFLRGTETRVDFEDVEVAFRATRKLQAILPRRQCSCIHDADVHDPETGACLYTNPGFGPCVCDATPEATRRALGAAWEQLKKASQ